jgi:hypothetical protein
MTFEPLQSVERRAVVDGVECRLWVDPIALEALRQAREAGGSPAEYGALPAPEELPLRVLVIETRLERLEAQLNGRRT